MNLSEVILILIIALVVFGPKKLPMLAIHLAMGLRFFNQIKDKGQLLWEQVLKEQSLLENEHKAQIADHQYQTQLTAPALKDEVFHEKT